MSKKPVVALITWLFAKPKNIKKYTDMYEKLGFDTVVLSPNVWDILRPQTVSKQSARKLLRQLNSDVMKDRPIFVNAFSMGGYQFSQTMHEALKPEFNSIRPRIRAALFDSPVDWQGVPNGISHAVSPKSLVGRRFVQSSISALLFLAHPFITKHLIEASRRFTDEPLPVPTLVVTSENDEIACVKRVHEVVTGFRDNSKLDVDLLCLPESRHVAHIVDHPELYFETVSTFVAKHFPEAVPSQ